MILSENHLLILRIFAALTFIHYGLTALSADWPRGHLVKIVSWTYDNTWEKQGKKMNKKFSFVPPHEVSRISFTYKDIFKGAMSLKRKHRKSAGDLLANWYLCGT